MPRHLFQPGNTWAVGQGPNQMSFKPGQVPWNKGQQGVHLSPATEFVKGHRPHNKLGVGRSTKRINDKTGQVRRWIKTKEPNKWVMYARYLWEYCYGTIPKGFVIHHKNGNPRDDRIENLEMMSRGNHAQLHDPSSTVGKLPKRPGRS